MQVNQPTIKGCVAIILPKQRVQVPESVTLSMDNALLQKMGLMSRNYGRCRLCHAFIGTGFRERPQAYDSEAALHDHIKYLNKKKTTEEMEQQY
ncbi:adaptin ear-binding coat-associated protein 1 NECAP-1 [Tanacetum coccineum]